MDTVYLTHKGVTVYHVTLEGATGPNLTFCRVDQQIIDVYNLPGMAGCRRNSLRTRIKIAEVDERET